MRLVLLRPAYLYKSMTTDEVLLNFGVFLKLIRFDRRVKFIFHDALLKTNPS